MHVIRCILRLLEHAYACRRLCNAHAWKLRGRADVLIERDNMLFSLLFSFSLFRREVWLLARTNINDIFLTWKNIRFNFLCYFFCITNLFSLFSFFSSCYYKKIFLFFLSNVTNMKIKWKIFDRNVFKNNLNLINVGFE